MNKKALSESDICDRFITPAISTAGWETYAMQGLVDGIRELIAAVRAEQLNVAWKNYVHETMSQFPTSPARDRQRSLVLAMKSGEVHLASTLEGLTPKLAVAYAKAGPRTLVRDLNRLKEVGLIVKRGRGWLANDRIIKAFLPPMADGWTPSAPV